VIKKKIVVVGLGVSGYAATSLLLSHNYDVIAVDRNIDTLKLTDKFKVFVGDNRVTLTADAEEIIWDNIIEVVVSPGITLTNSIIVEAKKNGVNVISEVELALRFLPCNICCIGITGTNGKTTVTKMTEFIINRANRKAIAVGNVGVSICSCVDIVEEGDVLVIELSSFQLELLHHQFLDVALITNIEKDHLDRYNSFDDYIFAKAKIQKCLKNNSCLWTQKIVVDRYSSFFDDKREIATFEGFLDRDKESIASFCQLIYTQKMIHYENSIAAYILCSYCGISSDIILDGITNFLPLNHRIERVGGINGISFYNDSKATNVSAVIHAVNILDKNNIVLIAGGMSKGQNFFSWIEAFKGRVTAIIAIGKDANVIKQQMIGFNVVITKVLDEAVMMAYNIAKKNEIVLLSPGCSSYDMFDNYEHRGNEFKRLVGLMKTGGRWR
jgi:UDP-N-acetylmuramoylalanine--D-glutamate ligase